MPCPSLALHRGFLRIGGPYAGRHAKTVETSLGALTLQRAGQILPCEGSVFIRVNSRQINQGIEMARRFAAFGFRIYATRGTAHSFRAVGLRCRTAMKVNEARPNALDLIVNRKIDLVENTPAGPCAFEDEKKNRSAAIQHCIPRMTTLNAAKAAVNAIAARTARGARVRALQDLYTKKTRTPA